MRSALGCSCKTATGMRGLGDAAGSGWSYYLDSLQAFAPTAIELYKKSQDDPAYLKMKKAEQDLQRLVLGGGSLQQIGDARARLEAAQRDVQLEAESLNSSREWSTLGKLVVVSGLGMAALGAIYVLSKVVK